MLLSLLNAALSGIVGNRADAAVVSWCKDPTWQHNVCDLVERMEGVELNRAGFAAWLNETDLLQLLAAYQQQEEPPETVVRRLIDGLDRHEVLSRRGSTPRAWQDVAEQVVLSTLLALPGATTEELRATFLVLRDTQALRDGQVRAIEQLLDQRDRLTELHRSLERSLPIIEEQLAAVRERLAQLPGRSDRHGAFLDAVVPYYEVCKRLGTNRARRAWVRSTDGYDPEEAGWAKRDRDLEEELAALNPSFAACDQALRRELLKLRVTCSAATVGAAEAVLAAGGSLGPAAEGDFGFNSAVSAFADAAKGCGC